MGWIRFILVVAFWGCLLLLMGYIAMQILFLFD